MDFLLAGAVVVALLILILAVGSYASLDRSGAYSRRAADLPMVSDAGTAGDGLVRIPAGDYIFRARVRNLDGVGDPVIMLHGWPQSSIAWEPLLDAAAKEGYRAAAFDLRGYSPEARPAGAERYTMDKLVDDVCRVADALGFERFHLVGHDWGAATGWALVMTRPERILSWSALSIPHSYSFLRALAKDRDQQRRSAYILLLRAPWLPEALLSWGRHRLMRRWMYRWMPEAHAAEYLELLAEPGALTAVLNFYRAMGKGKSMDSASGDRSAGVVRVGQSRSRGRALRRRASVTVHAGSVSLRRTRRRSLAAGTTHVRSSGRRRSRHLMPSMASRNALSRIDRNSALLSAMIRSVTSGSGLRVQSPSWNEPPSTISPFRENM